MLVPLMYILVSGMMATLAIGNTEELSWKYLRTVGAIVLAAITGLTTYVISVNSWQIDGIEHILSIICVVGVIAFFLLAPTFEKNKTLYRAITVISAVCAFVPGIFSALSAIQKNHSISTGFAVWTVAGYVLTSMLLGSITVSWLLGHAYLTQTKMTIAPLRRFSKVLTYSVWARIIFVTGSIIAGWVMTANQEKTYPDILFNQVIIVSLRFGIGLIAVAIFSKMVYECVKIRSTQSATGILYFASLFAYIGEMSSQYFLFQTGLPI